MLGTRERTLLLEGLRPPAGYHLRRAVGTSFVLDLMALLTVPLAFTYFDAHDEEGAPTSDAVPLLHALRRHAENVTVFCQAGAIGVPHPGQPLLAFIEESVIPVKPPNEGGIFHPKVWVINFESGDGPAIYRVLCLSRNLTFARAWDTCLSLEGQLGAAPDRRARNEPIADLLRSLPKLATRAVPADLAADIARMSDEIGRVDFMAPQRFTDFRVHNFGLAEPRGLPFPKGSRSLVISPFLTAGAVQELVKKHGLEVLISRPEAFAEVTERSGRQVLPKTCYVLSPGAGLDSRESEKDGADTELEGPSFGEDRIELAGLHAKLYLFEANRKAHLFVGSPNATGAAFWQNVEVLVELIGPAKNCGIAALLGSDDDPRHDCLRSLLQEFSCPGDSFNDDRNIKLERKAERLAYSIGAARLTAAVNAADPDQRWDVALSGQLPQIPKCARVRAWPSTLTAESAEAIGAPPNRCGEIATYQGLSLAALTGFFVFEICMRDKKSEVKKQFTVVADLVGEPADRMAIITQSLLSDRRRVLQLFLLILSSQDADLSTILQSTGGNATGDQRSLGGWESATLLESLLQSLDRDPALIDEAARLIADLRKTAEGRDLLPDSLWRIWEPIWQARQALK